MDGRGERWDDSVSLDGGVSYGVQEVELLHCGAKCSTNQKD